ncbi:MAG: hypothetical protein ACYCOU_08180 [Sulfobacillus sp.]
MLSPGPGIGFNYYVLALKKCDGDIRWTIRGACPIVDETHWSQFCNDNDPLSPGTVFPYLRRMNEDRGSCQFRDPPVDDFGSVLFRSGQRIRPSL